MVSLNERVAFLLIVACSAAFASAFSFSDLSSELQGGSSVRAVLDKYEYEPNREKIDEINALGYSLFEVRDGNWYFNGEKTKQTLLNGDINENGLLEPASSKGFIFKIQPEGNPFFALVFFRPGTISSTGMKQFEEHDSKKPSVGDAGGLVKFSILCFDGGAFSQCASEPGDFLGEWKTHPIGRVSLDDWKIKAGFAGIEDALRKTGLFKDAAGPVPRGVARLAGETKKLKIKYQTPNPTKDDFKRIALQGFDEVVFQLFAQSEEKDANPKAFAAALKGAKGLMTLKGLPLKAGAWVNLVEDNNKLITKQNENGLKLCKSGQSRGFKACIDDEETLTKVIAFYETAFDELKGELEEKNVKYLLSSVYLDFELPLDCTCTELKGTKLSEWRTQQAKKLYKGITYSIRKHLGYRVDVYNNAAEVQTACKSSIAGVNYAEYYDEFGVIPAPDPVELKGDRWKKLLENARECFENKITDAELEFPVYFNPMKEGKQACQDTKTTNEAYTHFLENKNIYGSLVLFEYKRMLEDCAATVPSFISKIGEIRQA